MPNCATLWTVARQAPLSMGFSRQGYWSGLPCSPPGDLPDPGIEPWSLMSTCIGRRLFLLLAPPGKPMDSISHLTGNTFTFNFGIIFQCFFFFFFLTISSYGLEQDSSNYRPQGTSGLLFVFVNIVWWNHRHTHLCIVYGCFSLQWQSWVNAYGPQA